MPPQSSQEVGARLKAIREAAGISQEQFGLFLKLSRDQVANFESGRTPLPFIVGHKFCFIYGSNQRWLATGKAPERPFVALPRDLWCALQHFDDSPFQEVYSSFLDEYVSGFINLGIHKVIENLRSSRPPEDPSILESFGTPATIRQSLIQMIDQLLAILPSAMLNDAFRWVANSLADFLSSNANAIIGAQPLLPGRMPGDPIRMNSLTSETCVSNLPAVIDSWSTLRSRVIALTSKRGERAALARVFNVTPQAVSEWVRGISMPNADLTIRLLAWVATEEAKKRRPGSADTPPERKTPKGIQSNEVPKSGRATRSPKQPKKSTS